MRNKLNFCGTFSDTYLTTICCRTLCTDLYIMEFYSFYCAHYVYYMQFYPPSIQQEAGWHSRGQRFDPVWLHQMLKIESFYGFFPFFPNTLFFKSRFFTEHYRLQSQKVQLRTEEKNFFTLFLWYVFRCEVPAKFTPAHIDIGLGIWYSFPNSYHLYAAKYLRSKQRSALCLC